MKVKRAEVINYLEEIIARSKRAAQEQLNAKKAKLDTFNRERLQPERDNWENKCGPFWDSLIKELQLARKKKILITVQVWDEIYRTSARKNEAYKSDPSFMSVQLFTAPELEPHQDESIDQYYRPPAEIVTMLKMLKFSDEETIELKSFGFRDLGEIIHRYG